MPPLRLVLTLHYFIPLCIYDYASYCSIYKAVQYFFAAAIGIVADLDNGTSHTQYSDILRALGVDLFYIQYIDIT